MDGMMIVLVCIGGLILFVVLIAAAQAGARSYHVRPHHDEMVQLSWRERESLERSSITSGFWKFLAKLEFVLLLCAGLWIWVLLNF
jgi:predicted transcriptional regulator